jgi:hypothetical protein
MTFHGMLFVPLLILFVANAFAENHCPPPYETPQPIGQGKSGTVQCKELPDARLQWIIERPAVGETLTEYPQIKFEKGQTVTVYAEGCVNVRATSSTQNNRDNHNSNHPDWRDYVDPKGDAVDRHYHGLIWIPGARIVHNGHLLIVPVSTAPMRIGSIAGTSGTAKQSDPEELVIDAPPAGIEPTLRLGYEGGLDRHPLCYLQGTCSRDYPTDPYPEAVQGPKTKQCKRAARVVITIATTCPKENSGQTAPSTRLTDQELEQSCSYAVPTSNPSRPLKPFDVVSSQVDENGFLLAPQWFNTETSGDLTRLKVSDECESFPYKQWWNIYRGVKSACTQQASFDVPRIFTECLLAPGFGQFHGHVNWAPATFVGKLEFQEVSADKDVDLQLQTIGDRILRFPGNADFGKIAPILTKDSQISPEYEDSLWLEFATYETTSYFQAPWNEIKFSTRSKAYDALKKQYNDRTAIVTGLLDLDCVHDCHTELHPVFAMAIRRKLESADSDIVDHDSWTMFIRDAGNEGDCSQDEHYLDRNGYTFFLPAPPGAGSGTPTVSSETLRSNEKGLTWSLERSSAPGSNGVLLRISFAPTQSACKRIHTGQMVHVSGVLDLDWRDTSTKALLQACSAPVVNSSPDNLNSTDEQRDTNPLYRLGSDCQKRLERESCGLAFSSNEDLPRGASDNFEASQNYWSEQHSKNPPDHSFPTLASQVGDFLGSDIGLFEELLLYNKTSQIQPNFGGRVGIIQTPLGSVEIDGSPGFSRSVKSSTGQNLSVKMSDWLAGLKIQFTQQLGMFAEFKGGDIYRSASSGYSSTPDFKNFHGHNALFLAGGGIQPGANVLAKGTKVTVRISVDYMRITGTGENMIRITVGPQFQIHRRGE